MKVYISGDLRGVRHRDIGNGTHRRAHPSSGVVPAVSIDKGGREDNQKQQWAGVVPRVIGIEEEAVGRGAVGRRIFRTYSRRPDDSGRDN